jgi:hypothetical protein
VADRDKWTAQYTRLAQRLEPPVAGAEAVLEDGDKPWTRRNRPILDGDDLIEFSEAQSWWLLYQYACAAL